VLRALNRLLRPGGVIAFTTIYVTPGLAAPGRQRARRLGPRAVASRSQQASLLATAGYVDIEQLDLTADFATTARAWLAECESNAAELAKLEPPGAFQQRQRERRTQLAAIEDGLLRRGLFSATRPHSSRPTASRATLATIPT
jgi:hypothetical protein